VLILASDFTRVTGVTVTITDAGDNVIEEGPCTEALNLDHWVYTATTVVDSTAGPISRTCCKVKAWGVGLSFGIEGVPGFKKREALKLV
jgi:hypothetical protein